MQSLFEHVRDLIPYFPPLPWAIGTALVAIAVPVLHSATGKTHIWLGPRKVLSLYVFLMLAGFFFHWIGGAVLSQFAPSTFEAWRSGVQSGLSSNPAALVAGLMFVMPYAFAVSSLAYGILAGWKGIVLSLFGLAVALGMAWIALMLGLGLACMGWSSCL